MADNIRNWKSAVSAYLIVALDVAASEVLVADERPTPREERSLGAGEPVTDAVVADWLRLAVNVRLAAAGLRLLVGLRSSKRNVLRSQFRTGLGRVPV